MLTGDHVPGWKRIVNRRITGTTEHRQANFTVHRVIQCAATMPITGEIQIDQIFAAGSQFFIRQPSPRWKITDEQTCVFTWCGNESREYFLAFRFPEIDSDGTLALIEAVPVETPAGFGDGPAPVVDAAADLIEANHIRAQLRQRHAAGRRGNKCTSFDDTQSS